MNHKKNVLTIAGSDPSGGAGLQADLKTFEAFHVYGASVVSAITVQNTQGVSSVFDLPAELVDAQLASVLSDIRFSAIKTGMLKTSEQIQCIAGQLRLLKDLRLVIDPVLISSSGFRLQDQDATDVMISELFPLSTLITPNLPEAACLLNRDLSWVSAFPEESCRLLIERYTLNAVLLKGGHSENNYCEDILAIHADSTLEPIQIQAFKHAKQHTQHTHGTGCTLASAIAACLAKEMDLINAVALSVDYLQHAIKRSNEQAVGKGNGPLNHQAASKFMCE